MSLTRIHNLSISLDGFATGEPQSAEAPFGHAGQRLHGWMFDTRFWDPGGTSGVDELALATGLGPATVLGALTALEIRGLVIEAYGRYRASGPFAAGGAKGRVRVTTRPAA